MWSVSKHLSEFSNCIIGIIKAILEEIKPTKYKTMPQILNLVGLLGFLVVVLLTGIPYALGEQKSGYVILSAILCFTIVAISSGFWLYKIDCRKALKKSIDDALGR